jgi:hypothetical protein
MAYLRMLNEDHRPLENEIHSFIGNTDLWLDLKQYLDQNYNFIPELVFYGRKYGWTIRYRKSGKTLCSLFPEQGAFTTLIVLGKKEGEKSSQTFNMLSTEIRNLIGSAKHLHDGKWLWIRVFKQAHVEDVKQLLAIKRKPSVK